jgi:hypothetical protein
MTKLVTVRPTESFSIALPEGIRDQRDERVSSFWVEGKPLLLQVSSYIRTEGEQLNARERLAQRMAKHNENWSVWKEKAHSDQFVDQATGEFLDAERCLWVHSYLVWPHLTIYVTISGPHADVRRPDNWAISAIRSIEVTPH